MSVKEFKLGPCDYNYVLLKKNFLKFKKGDIIWADHSGGKYAYYCYTNGQYHVIKKRNSQHLASFYRSAVPMVGTIWNSEIRKRGKFKIIEFSPGICKEIILDSLTFRSVPSDPFYASKVEAIHYFKDKKATTFWGKVRSEYEMMTIYNYYKCINIDQL